MLWQVGGWVGAGGADPQTAWERLDGAPTERWDRRSVPPFFQRIVSHWGHGTRPIERRFPGFPIWGEKPGLCFLRGRPHAGGRPEVGSGEMRPESWVSWLSNPTPEVAIR